MLFNLVLVIKEKVGVTIELVNLGGGFGIPYRPEEKVIDVQAWDLLGWCLKPKPKFHVRYAKRPIIRIFMDHA